MSRDTDILGAGLVDGVAFGRPFIANPDFPARLRHGWPLANFDPVRLFGGDQRGYLDFEPYKG